MKIRNILILCVNDMMKRYISWLSIFVVGALFFATIGCEDDDNSDDDTSVITAKKEVERVNLLSWCLYRQMVPCPFSQTYLSTDIVLPFPYRNAAF